MKVFDMDKTTFLLIAGILVGVFAGKLMSTYRTKEEKCREKATFHCSEREGRENALCIISYYSGCMDLK